MPKRTRPVFEPHVVRLALPNGQTWDVYAPRRPVTDLAGAARLSKYLHRALRVPPPGPNDRFRETHWWNLPRWVRRLRLELSRCGVRRQDVVIEIACRERPTPAAPHGWFVVSLDPVAFPWDSVVGNRKQPA